MTIPDSKRTFGDVPEDFRQFVINTAIKESEPVKIKRFSVVALAIFLVLALACSAFAAVMLTRSPAYDAAKAARAMMQAQYGLSQASLGVFDERITETNDGWIVEYLPLEYASYLGAYRITLPMDAASTATISWSHDDKIASRAGVWGEEQIAEHMRVISIHQEMQRQMGAEKGPQLNWSIADYASIDTILLENPAYQEAMELHLLPGADDVPEPEAIALMKDFLTQAYGVTGDVLASYTPHITFSKMPGAETPHYMLMLYKEPPAENMPITDAYYVEMASPSAEIRGHRRESNPEATFPESDDFNNAPAIDSWMDVAIYQTQMREAGHDRDVYRAGIPGEDAVPFERALEIAKAALLDEYGVDATTFSLLGVAPTFVVSDPEHPVWEFSIFSVESDDSYQIILDGMTGDVLTNVYYFVGNG